MIRLTAVHRVLQLKQWELANLPASSSMLAQRVFFHLVDAFNTNQIKSIKVLSLELPFSVAAIRIQIRKLERDGWITIAPGASDSRERFIGMSTRTVGVLKEYEREANRLRFIRPTRKKAQPKSAIQ